MSKCCSKGDFTIVLRYPADRLFPDNAAHIIALQAYHDSSQQLFQGKTFLIGHDCADAGAPRPKRKLLEFRALMCDGIALV